MKFRNNEGRVLKEGRPVRLTADICAYRQKGFHLCLIEDAENAVKIGAGPLGDKTTAWHCASAFQAAMPEASDRTVIGTALYRVWCELRNTTLTRDTTGKIILKPQPPAL